MNASERDELLSRVDERTLKMTGDMSEMKEWQRDQNGDIKALQIEQARLRGRIYGGAAVLSCVYVVVQAGYLILI